MDIESRRAELAARIKASFHEAGKGTWLELYAQILDDVYSRPKQEEQIVETDSTIQRLIEKA